MTARDLYADITDKLIALIEANPGGKRRVARASYVFNAAQVEGYALPTEPELGGPIERRAAVDRFVANLGAVITFGGDRAYYRPSTDEIVMPDEARFLDTPTMTRNEAFYATELHECLHYADVRIMPTCPRHGLAHGENCRKVSA